METSFSQNGTRVESFPGFILTKFSGSGAFVGLVTLSLRDLARHSFVSSWSCLGQKVLHVSLSFCGHVEREMARPFSPRRALSLLVMLSKEEPSLIISSEAHDTSGGTLGGASPCTTQCGQSGNLTIDHIPPTRFQKRYTD